mgnify:CR=1 FL=1
MNLKLKVNNTQLNNFVHLLHMYEENSITVSENILNLLVLKELQIQHKQTL